MTDRSTEASRELRTAMMHLLAKLDDTKLQLGDVVNVAYEVWGLAEGQFDYSEFTGPLSELDDAIGAATAAIVREVRAEIRAEERERFLGYVRARREGESEKDRLARLRRFGIDDVD